MAICYIDTSVILRLIFGEKNPFKKWEQFEAAYSSSLLKVEALRSIDRLRLQGKLTDDEVSSKVQALYETMKYLGEIPVHFKIVERASASFPVVIATLDALHLSSAWFLRDKKKQSPVFLTHDIKLARAAQAIGFEILEI